MSPPAPLVLGGNRSLPAPRCTHRSVTRGRVRPKRWSHGYRKWLHPACTVRTRNQTARRTQPCADSSERRVVADHDPAQPYRGRHEIAHPWGATSVLGNAFRHDVPLTVHPGIGYDIISNHPLFNGAALGRAAGLDFATFGGSVEGLDNGVVLSVGSAIMGPQVFEKASPASTTSVYKPAEKLSAAMQFTWWIFRMAAAGTGLRANRPRITQPIICAFAKLRPYGRHHALRPVRQYRFHASLAE